MAVRYTITEENGYQHTRTSRGHKAPIYTHAVVKSPGCGASLVSYASRLDLAQAELRAATKQQWMDNERNRAAGRVGSVHPDAKIYPVTAEVLPEPKPRGAKSPLNPSSTAADFARR